MQTDPGIEAGFLQVGFVVFTALINNALCLKNIRHQLAHSSEQPQWIDSDCSFARDQTSERHRLRFALPIIAPLCFQRIRFQA